MTPSASGIPRALRCPTSLVLPRHQFDSAHAEAGTEHHEDLEAAIDIGDESAIPEEILALIEPGDEMITERAFAYDVATDTGRELAVTSKRAYEGLGPFEIPGTPDLVIRGPRRIIVVDHKSFEEVDPAEKNAQIATYALTVARAWGYDEAEVMIHYKIRRPSFAVLGPLDLDAHAARLKQLQLDAAKAARDPLAFLNDGPWCKYCEAHLDCPKWDGLRKMVRSDFQAVVPFERDEDAVEAFDLLGRIKMLAGRIEGALRARAKERPIPLPDGRVFGAHDVTGKRKLDGDAAYQMIREKYGQQVADKAVVRTASQKGIELALKDAGIPSPGKAKSGIVKALEDAGAVERKTTTRIEVYEPKKVAG